MHVQTHVMLLCKIFSSATLKDVHAWKFNGPSSSQCLDILDCKCKSRHAAVYDLLLRVQTHLMLLCKIFSLTTLKEVHEWKFNGPSSSQCLDILDCKCKSRHAAVYDLLLRVQTHLMLLCKIFSSTTSKRLMGGSSKAQAAANAWTSWIVIAESRHATVLDLHMHLQTHDATATSLQRRSERFMGGSSKVQADTNA